MKKLILITLLFNVIYSLGYSQTKTKWEIKNLSINDRGINMAPAFYGPNKVVFSTEKKGIFQMYIGDFSGEDVSGKTLFLKGETHQMGVTFSRDLQTMYFTRSMYGEENTVKIDKDKRKSLAIFSATKSGNGWTNITSLPFNNVKYDVAHPALSNDGSKLYFSSNMPGTLGQSDIFVVDVLGNNTFSKPRNLGKNINTKRSELYPYVASNNSFYFSSTGHNSLGGLDIFYTKIDGSDKAYRLSAPINSSYDDFSYTYNLNKQQGFFTSNRPKGKGQDDVYLFQIKKDEPVGCSQKVEGIVYLNATQQIIPNALIKLKDDNENIIETFETTEGASFSFNVKCSTSYKIEASKDGFKTSEKIMVTNAQNSVTARKNIFLTTTKDLVVSEKKDPVSSVFFEYNKVDLEQRHTYALDKAIIMMKKNKKLNIYFESHTDSRAETDFNMQLAVDRIAVLKEYLGFKGIYRKRITGDAFGETKPLNHCTKEVECTEEEYLINRRTTFVLTEK